MPDTDQPVVSDTATVPAAEDNAAEYVATKPIFIDGVRAYNEGDPVTAAAVSKNNLRKFVEKVSK